MTVPQKHFTVLLLSLASGDHTVHLSQTTLIDEGLPQQKDHLSQNRSSG